MTSHPGRIQLGQLQLGAVSSDPGVSAFTGAVEETAPAALIDGAGSVHGGAFTGAVEETAPAALIDGAESVPRSAMTSRPGSIQLGLLLLGAISSASVGGGGSA